MPKRKTYADLPPILERLAAKGPPTAAERRAARKRAKRTLPLVPALARLDVLRAKIERQKARIAVERDKLRALVDDVTEIVETIEEGTGMAEEGLRELERGSRTLQDAVDEMSKLL